MGRGSILAFPSVEAIYGVPEGHLGLRVQILSTFAMHMHVGFFTGLLPCSSPPPSSSSAYWKGLMSKSPRAGKGALVCLEICLSVGEIPILVLEMMHWISFGLFVFLLPFVPTPKHCPASQLYTFNILLGGC